MDVLYELRSYLTKPHVRPWALAAPLLVLLFCIPLLRPLRHPDPTQMSDDELARLATIQSLVERHTLNIDRSSLAPAHKTVRIGKTLYADQPATLALLLAGPYWVMHHFGITFGKYLSLVEFLLTLLGITIPVAIASGLIYRMGRIFELPRWKRSLLSIVVAFGSGLVSYAVVLNTHAPAAALLIGSTACLAHVAISRRPALTTSLLAISGLCAGLAATIEPAAVIFTLLLIAVIPAMRWKPSLRLVGMFMYLIGLAPPLLLHAALTVHITGDLLPINWHPEFHAAVDLTADNSPVLDDDDSGRFAVIEERLARLTQGIFGEHGILSHFPILVLGIAGIFAVMHRHWPATVKILAAGTGIAAAVILAGYCIVTRVGPGSTFAARHFLVFLPILLFWAGAWFRKNHHPITWTLAAFLLLFSTTASLLGATDPCPPNGYDHYSLTQALSNLIHPTPNTNPTILAGG